MFSSENQAWATRWEYFNKWNDRFKFTLDTCAGNGDQKCDEFFTPEQDGLKQDWNGGTFWCNPPYGREY
ncbi:MAG: DNA N-6-adenine-methyltransferase, partial [Marinomonas gallaica]